MNQASGTQQPSGNGSYIADYVDQLRPEFAGFWLRFAAYLIDLVILGIAESILSSMTGYSYTIRFDEDGWYYRVVTYSVTSMYGWINIAYFVIMESSTYQGTLGKLVLGLQVTDMQGQRISFLRALGRFFAKYLSAIILGIGFIMAGFTEKKQALHDMLAGTLVVRK